MTDAAADTKLQTMYCNHMQEIKSRSALVRSVLSGGKTLGSAFHDYEVFALNMRKILELIAYSSLIANKEKYAEAHEKFDRHYKAKCILQDMEKIHPEFYPVPADIQMKTNGIRLLQEAQNGSAMTKNDFVELYDKCSKVLHAWNPFDPAPRKVDFRLSPLQWIDKSKDLLNTHYVRLVDDAGYWLCEMQSAEDGKPHVYTLCPVENPEDLINKDGRHY
jgi:hypothetical protein